MVRARTVVHGISFTNKAVPCAEMFIVALPATAKKVGGSCVYEWETDLGYCGMSGMACDEIQ